MGEVDCIIADPGMTNDARIAMVTTASKRYFAFFIDFINSLKYGLRRLFIYIFPIYTFRRIITSFVGIVSQGVLQDQTVDRGNR